MLDPVSGDHRRAAVGQEPAAQPKAVSGTRAARPWSASPRTGPSVPGSAVVTDKGLAGQDTEEFVAGDGLRLTLDRPARKDEKQPRPFPDWLRQRVEAVIWTLKNQLGLERHGGRKPAGLWTRAVQRLLALDTIMWFNWLMDRA